MVRLGFAVAAHLEPEILLVDEVLAVGDIEFQKKCVGKMKDVSRSGRTVLFVSHNMASIKALCSEAMILENGEMNFSGNVIEAVNNYIASNLAISGSLQKANKVISSKEVNFVEARLLNSAKEEAGIIFYKENFEIELTIESTEEYPFAVIDITLGNEEERLVYISSYDHYKGFIRLEKGLHCYTVQIPNQLMPARYFIHLGCHIHNTGGIRTKALLDYVIQFEVSDSTVDGVNNYPFQINFGHVHSGATWTKNK